MTSSMTEQQAKEHLTKCNQCRGFLIHLYKLPCTVFGKFLKEQKKKEKKNAKNR